MAFCFFFTEFRLTWDAADIPLASVGDVGIAGKSTPGGCYGLVESKAHSSGRAPWMLDAVHVSRMAKAWHVEALSRLSVC